MYIKEKNKIKYMQQEDSDYGSFNNEDSNYLEDDELDDKAPFASFEYDNEDDYSLDEINSNKENIHLNNTTSEDIEVIKKNLEDSFQYSYIDKLIDEDDLNFINQNECNVMVNPSKDYQDNVQALRDKLDDHFNDITKKSNVDYKENKKLIQELSLSKENHTEKNKSINKNNKIASILYVVIGVDIFFIISLFGGFIEYKETKKMFGALPLWTGFPLMALAIAILILALLYIFLKLKKENTKLKSKMILNVDEIEQKTTKAGNMMLPLLDYIKMGIAPSIINKVLPNVRINKTFSAEKALFMQEEYDIKLYNKDISHVNVVSGLIINNPFLVLNYRMFYLDTITYTNSVDIEWSVYMNGNTYRRTQTLDASIIKPRPVYSHESEFIYTNDSAPNLNFSRQPSEYHKVAGEPKLLEDYLRSAEHYLKELHQEAIIKNHPFTPLNNIEFEIAFGALNRNNENEYRILFTPLAQRQLLELLRSTESGFMDNYYIDKIGKVVYMKAPYSMYSYVDISPIDLFDISYDKIREKLFDYVENYFNDLYHLMAPILAIPEFQLNENFEFKGYKRVNQKFSKAVHEMCANAFAKKNPIEPDEKNSYCETIFNTKYIGPSKYFDIIEVNARSFEGIEKIEIIKKVGGDGKIHKIEIPWTKYLPCEKKSLLAISYVDDLSQNEINKLTNYCEELNLKSIPVIINNHIIFYENDIKNLSEEQILKLLNNKI